MPQLIGPPACPAVLLHVAAFAEQLEVVPVQRHVRVREVLRRQLHLVVHLIARDDQPLRPAPLTQAALTLLVRSSALDPWP